MQPLADYLWRQIQIHAGLFFSPRCRELLNPQSVVFLPYGEAIQTTTATVAIPTDVPVNSIPQSPYHVPFNGTSLTLWNPIPRPAAAGWKVLPHEQTPLWYQNQAGSLIPAWNLFGNCLGLLTLQEERETPERDRHGRFPARYSPRRATNLLRVPAFNEAVAALIAACAGLQETGAPSMHLSGLAGPATLVLSHDCDLLRGNDIWTQMVRGFRIMQPVRHAKFPRLSNLWWIARNALSPARYYLDNLAGMIDLERQFGFTSTFYLLNGTGGRFGARSGARLLPAAVRAVPHGWDIGIHYNYDTHLNRERFNAQLDSHIKIAPTAQLAGRAHYLRFDPDQSPRFLSSFSVRCDESAGFPDEIGYRCGLGGCFRLLDAATNELTGTWEVPLAIQDEILLMGHADAAVRVFCSMLSHLNCVGGALSLLFHPGVFFNPEFPGMLNLYHRLLIEARQLGVRSVTAPKLVKMTESLGVC